MDLLEPYFDKFYEIIPTIIEKRDREFAEVFLGLCPTFMARDHDETKIKELLDKADTEKKFFI